MQILAKSARQGTWNTQAIPDTTYEYLEVEATGVIMDLVDQICYLRQAWNWIELIKWNCLNHFSIFLNKTVWKVKSPRSSVTCLKQFSFLNDRSAFLMETVGNNFPFSLSNPHFLNKTVKMIPFLNKSFWKDSNFSMKLNDQFPFIKEKFWNNTYSYIN